MRASSTTATALAVMFAALLVVAPAAAQVSVAMTNADFQDPPYSNLNNVTGWTISGTGTRAIVLDVQDRFTSGASADGGPYALVIKKNQDINVFQELAETFESNREYSLTFAAG